jgi:hypothetical protein
MSRAPGARRSNGWSSASRRVSRPCASPRCVIGSSPGSSSTRASKMRTRRSPRSLRRGRCCSASRWAARSPPRSRASRRSSACSVSRPGCPSAYRPACAASGSGSYTASSTGRYRRAGVAPRGSRAGFEPPHALGAGWVHCCRAAAAVALRAPRPAAPAPSAGWLQLCRRSRSLRQLTPGSSQSCQLRAGSDTDTFGARSGGYEGRIVHRIGPP